MSSDFSFTLRALPAARVAPAAPADPCAACGVCCHVYLVPLSGADVWRLHAGTGESPGLFAQARVRGAPGPDAFRLAPQGPWYSLVLAKQGAVRPGQPCRFLAAAPAGTTRCSVYAHRPAACRTYPMRIWSGVVYQRDDARCPPGSWDAAEPQRPAWRTALHALTLEQDVYVDVVARWNASVAAGPESGMDLGAFFAYLLAVYARFAALDAAQGPAAQAALMAGWPPIPRADGAFVSTQPGAPWRAYLAAVRAILDASFPTVPPLAWPALAPES